MCKRASKVVGTTVLAVALGGGLPSGQALAAPMSTDYTVAEGFNFHSFDDSITYFPDTASVDITGSIRLAQHYNGALLVGLMPVGTHETWTLGQSSQVGAFGYFGGQSEGATEISPSDGWPDLIQDPRVATEGLSIDFDMTIGDGVIDFSTSIGDFSQTLAYSDDFSDGAHFTVSGWAAGEYEEAPSAFVQGEISSEFAEGQVPLPGSIALFALGLGVMGLIAGRGTRVSQPNPA